MRIRASRSSVKLREQRSRLQLGQEKGKVSITTRAREKNRSKSESKQGLVVSRQSNSARHRISCLRISSEHENQSCRSSAKLQEQRSRLQLGQEKGKVSIATRARERKSLDRNEGERKDRNEGESKQGLV